MPYVEVSLFSLATRASLPKEEMAYIIDYIRRGFPYRSSDHFYRSSSDYLVIHTTKERLTRKQESWLEDSQAVLYTHPDTNSGYLALGPGLLGDGLFTGTVDTARRIQFTVPGVSGNGSLHFSGIVQA